MSVDHLKNREGSEASFGLQPYLLRFVAVAVALLVILPVLPGLASNLVYSFSGEAPKIYWYLSRSAGFVALTILWISMVLGLGISNKMARLWPGAPAAFAIHEYVSLLGLAFTLYHGLILIGDHYVDFSLPRLLMPFSIENKPFWVGLGQTGFYIWVIVTASFYVRSRIGQKAWRLIHYANFAIYLMGLLHGIFSGTDSTLTWVRWYYLGSGGILLILLVYRVYDSTLKNKFSLSKFVQQGIQNSWKHPLTLRVRNALEARLPKRVRSLTSPKSNTGMPDTPATTSITSQTTNRDSAAVDENTDPQTSDKPVVEAQPHSPSESPATDPAPAAPTIKLGNTSSKNKIRVRIFKEPAARSTEPQKEPEKK